jgi:NADH dehydrogenase
MAHASHGAHRIVIVGGGAGGLALAARLGRSLGRKGRAQIALVDISLQHLWKPLLHEVAAGTLDSHADAIEFLAQARVHGFRFRLGRMEGLDRQRREIHLGPITDPTGVQFGVPQIVGYDTLVIAVGCTVNDFGIPGVKEHCLLLDRQDQAEHCHRLFLAEHLRAQAQSESDEAEGLTIAIVGAGATGVELAAELHTASRQFIDYGLDRMAGSRGMRLVLLDAAPRILPGMSERVAELAATRLQEIGVEVHTGEQVTRVTAQGLQTDQGRSIGCRMTVWAAGIKAPEFLRELDGLETNKLNQLVVRPTLQTTRSDEIFALGDCAQAPWLGHDRPVPPLAQAAHQQAELLAKALVRRLDGRPLPPFRFRDRGSLVSLGQENALGALMGSLLGTVTFEGRVAYVAYRSLYRAHQRAVFGVPRTALLMLADWFRRGVRPSFKLH